MTRTDARRTEILRHASDAFRRHGVDGAGMRDIARALGVSAGNLYYYFRNKDELVYACQDETLDRLLEAVDGARREHGARRQLEALVRGHLRVLLASPVGGAVHLEVGSLPPRLYRQMVKKRDRYERRVRALIAGGQKTGELKAGDPKLAAFALLGALNWSARWYHPEGKQGVDEIEAHFCAFLLDGLVQGEAHV